MFSTTGFKTMGAAFCAVARAEGLLRRRHAQLPRKNPIASPSAAPASAGRLHQGLPQQSGGLLLNAVQQPPPRSPRGPPQRRLSRRGARETTPPFIRKAFVSTRQAAPYPALSSSVKLCPAQCRLIPAGPACVCPCRQMFYPTCGTTVGNALPAGLCFVAPPSCHESRLKTDGRMDSAPSECALTDCALTDCAQIN